MHSTEPEKGGSVPHRQGGHAEISVCRRGQGEGGSAH